MTSKYFHEISELGLLPYIQINGFENPERFRYHLICENNRTYYEI